ncbi:MAG: HYR domain-containing protein [Saprospiraceae bacterium]|nr:HYR domain-containing protein [Saprospiraceae bacterium]
MGFKSSVDDVDEDGPIISKLSEVGCYTFGTRFVLANDCGSTIANTEASGACFSSNFINLLVIPDAPVITPPANTCAAPFTLPNVTLIDGYNVEWSIDGLPFTGSPVIPSTHGCHSIRARYVSANACGPIPSGSAGPAPCNQSNLVNVVIFPQIVATPGTVTRASQCGITDATFTWSGPAPTTTLSGVVPASGSFELRYDIDGGTAFTNTTGVFTNVAPGCHTIEARYVLTTTCGSTTAPAVAPAACGVSQTFVVWPLLSNTNIPILTLANNCGSAATISNVDISNAPSLPAGMQFVYFYYRNGGGLEGPVTLDVLKTIDFSYNALGAAPGCHKIDARINLSVACGSIPANDGLFSPGMSFCRTASINFLTFPTPPTLSVNTVCNGGNLVVTPTPLSAPANHIWAYRLINTTGTPIVGAWQSTNTFVNPPTGCYRIEATPVRNINCDNPPPGLIDAPVLLPPNGLIFPTDIQMPLVNQNGGNPAVISAACTSSIDAFVLPAPPMAITPNNITVCLGDQGKIDLQYFEQMVPSCLVDPVTGFGPATISYIVTSSDPLVVAPGSYTNLLNNVPELMWMGQNGNNFPNVVTIGVTPRITLGGVSCDGAEVKFSITVQPNFTVTTPWVIDPNTASQCANNNGWTVSTTANTRVGCQYELYFNPSTSPLAAPIGNALVQMINGNGAPVSFQKFYIPGTYQVWERCNGCAELAATFNVQIIGAPVLTDILLETCPSNPGGNTGLFSGITYPTPAATVPPSVVTILGYYKTFTGAVNATPADLISSTGGFNYTSSDAVIYIRIGQNVDGLPGDDCFHIGRIELRVVNRPVVYLTANPNPTCTNSIVTINSNVSNTSGSTITYQWERVSPTIGAIAATTSSITVTESSAGAYVYRVTVTDPNTGTNGSDGPVCTTTQDITVNYSAPTITCPANFTVATDPGVCTAYQNLQPALVNSLCASNYVVKYYTTGVTVIGTSAAPVDLSVLNATPFAKSTTTVNAVVGTIVAGVFTPVSPAVTCSYTVEVKDTEFPIAKCKNTTVFLDANGMASITATDINSGSTDNCMITSTVANPTSFTCANVGMNAVTLTVTDMSSNTNTCTAMVQVIDNTAPTLVCPASVTMNVTPSIGCTWTAAALAPTTASDNCTPAPILTYSIINPDQTVRSGTGNVNGLIFDKGTSIVSYTLTDGSGNKSICTFTVTVLDNVVPVITNCPVDVTVEITTPTTVTITPSPSSTNGNYAATVDGCGVNLTYTPPTVSDNCPMSRIELTQGVGGTSHYYDAGTIHVERYVATDMSNNTASCQFTITVKDKVLPTISCPANLTVGTDPSTNCLAFVPLTPNVSDNCGNTNLKHFFANGSPAPSQLPNPAAISVATAVSGLTSGAFYPATNGTSGSTIVTYIVTDASGNTAACSTTVTVQDDDVPQIVCPQSITLNANKDCQGVLGAPFTASATDNCSSMTVSYVITGATTVASTSGTAVPTSQLFNLGISFVTFTVTDANDNKATCTSTVTVKDVTAPTFDCPAAVTVNADANCIGTYAVVAPANQADNCTASGNLTWSVVPTSGNALPLGTTYFVYTVTDLSGNTKTCSQAVTVIDKTKPTITCPPSIAVGTDASNTCSANVPLTPAVFDNCTNTTITTSYSNGVPAPSALPSTILGGLFSLGQTIVTFTVTDANNNSQICSMTVTVTDDDAPIIMCPPSVTVGTGARTTCDAVLPSLNLMSASDNCTILTTSNVQYSLGGATILGNTNTTGSAPNFGVPASQVYNNGLTVVTFTATDAAGNKSVCTSNVTVIDNTHRQHLFVQQI